MTDVWDKRAASFGGSLISPEYPILDSGQATSCGGCGRPITSSAYCPITGRKHNNEQRPAAPAWSQVLSPVMPQEGVFDAFQSNNQTPRGLRKQPIMTPAIPLRKPSIGMVPVDAPVGLHQNIDIRSLTDISAPVLDKHISPALPLEYIDSHSAVAVPLAVPPPRSPSRSPHRVQQQQHQQQQLSIKSRFRPLPLSPIAVPDRSLELELAALANTAHEIQNILQEQGVTSTLIPPHASPGSIASSPPRSVAVEANGLIATWLL